MHSAQDPLKNIFERFLVKTVSFVVCPVCLHSSDQVCTLHALFQPCNNWYINVHSCWKL